MRAASRSTRYRLAALGLFCALGLAFGGAAVAQVKEAPAPIYTEIIIPTSDSDTQSFPTLDKRVEYFAEGKVVDLAQYLGIVYNFLISIVGIVASVMMIVAGFQYLTSAGDAGKIGAAKSRMANAFMGLILVLGAYTILSTINPALVVLKMPGVRDVSTETISLPWCDEIIKAGATVNPVQGEPNYCGSVGEYMQGKTRLACLYRSACPNSLGKEVPGVLRDSALKGALRATCVQTLTTSAYVNEPFKPEQVFAFSERGAKFEKWQREHPGEKAPGGCGSNFSSAECAQYNDWYNTTISSMPSPYAPMEARPASLLVGHIQSFARCMSCIEYGAVEKKSSDSPGADGYVYQTPHPGRCAYWQNTANGGVGLAPGAWEKRKAANQPLLSFCRWMEEDKGCAQVDFTCEEPTASSNCSNYDGLKPFYMFDMVKGGYVWWEYGSKIGTLSSRPDALQDICTSNPCGYNLAAKGCTGAGGLINGVRSAAAIVRDGISGIQECVNQ